MPPIINRKTCSLTEISDLKHYLSRTPVRSLVDAIDMVGVEVSKGEIVSLTEIGNLKTIWKNLGSIKSADEYGSETFLVSQVLQALRNPRCNDPNRILEKIEKYVKLIANNQLELKITLVEDRDGLTIFDGNTRVVAFFEYFSQKMQCNISLPTYVITLPRNFKITLGE